MGRGGSAGGTGVLLQILERQSERDALGHGLHAAVPAPRAAHRLGDAAGHGDSALVLPQTGPAAVAGPPAAHPSAHLADRSADHLADRSAERPVDAPSRARVLVAVAGLGLVAACWSGASAMLADRVPEGTTVAGTAIGGLSRDDAVAALFQSLTPRLDAPLPVALDTAGGAARTASIDPGAAHLELDAAATVSRAIGPVGLPTTLWHQLRGRGEVAPVVVADPAGLSGAVDRVAVALDVPAVEGAISFATGAPVPTQPSPGTAVERDAAAALVLRDWLSPAGDAARAGTPLVLPHRDVVPAVTAAAVAQAMQGQALPAVSAPLTVVVGDRRVVLTPEQVAPALSLAASTAGSGALHLTVDGAELAAAVVAADPATTAPAQDARLDTSGAAPVVVPAVAGSEPDAASLPLGAARALVASGTERVVEATTRSVPAALGTEDLTALGVTTLLGQVVSPLTADPARSADVTLLARALDGAVIAPGEVLDVGARLGAPSQESGYQPAAVVVDGRATTTLTAGSAQVASALHAAAVAAGLQVDARTAPASWNPRDPVGLDAVVGPGDPLVISELGPTGAVVRAEVTGGSLRVQVWGGAGRTVALATSAATDPRPALQVVDASPQCVPQPGQDGFTTTVTRTTTQTGATAQAGAQPVVDEVTTTYAPRTAITCAVAPAPAAPVSID